MQDIIKISQASIGDNLIETVNARELHEFLEVGKDFSTWIKDRITKYDFTENVDFVVFPEIGENLQGGRPTKEYAITIDMAKELSMVERNERGKQARQYFIECERRAKEPIHSKLNDPDFLRGTLLSYTERVLALEAERKANQPKLEAFERIAEADGSLCITDAAKALQMRPKDLFSYLQSNGWIYKRPGANHFLGYQSKVTTSLLEHKVSTVLRADGSEKITEQVRLTPKGMAKLAQLIKPALAA